MAFFSFGGLNDARMGFSDYAHLGAARSGGWAAGPNWPVFDNDSETSRDATGGRIDQSADAGFGKRNRIR
jgi:hypothetical protein